MCVYVCKSTCERKKVCVLHARVYVCVCLRERVHEREKGPSDNDNNSAK